MTISPVTVFLSIILLAEEIASLDILRIDLVCWLDHMFGHDINDRSKDLYRLGLCDNRKTYILILHGKIISIMIVISINDNKSIVHVSWIFATLKLLCIATITPHTCMFCIVHNSIQEFTIILIIKFIYLSHDNGFISRLSNYLNYCTALLQMH